MRDVYEVLRQKEADVARVRHEIESLLLTASLLRDQPTSDNLDAHRESPTETGSEHDPDSKAIGTNGLVSSVSDSRPRFWRVFKRGE
jgi:hypothetical protein